MTPHPEQTTVRVGNNLPPPPPTGHPDVMRLLSPTIGSRATGSGNYPILSLLLTDTPTDHGGSSIGRLRHTASNNGNGISRVASASMRPVRQGAADFLPDHT